MTEPGLKGAHIKGKLNYQPIFVPTSNFSLLPIFILIILDPYALHFSVINMPQKSSNIH